VILKHTRLDAPLVLVLAFPLCPPDISGLPLKLMLILNTRFFDPINAFRHYEDRAL
jgi:hypothetical protein